MEVEIIKNRLEQIVENAKQDEDVLAIFLFGSFVKERKFRDVDVCLVLSKKLSNIEMSRKRLEYLAKFPEFDIQIFQQLPIFIRIRILKEGKCLCCKNEDLLYDLAFKTIREFEDFKPYYKAYLESVLNG
jgi:predicted nucleotidyltransferase